jgi:hypothetical protein
VESGSIFLLSQNNSASPHLEFNHTKMRIQKRVDTLDFDDGKFIGKKKEMFYKIESTSMQKELKEGSISFFISFYKVSKRICIIQCDVPDPNTHTHFF